MKTKRIEAITSVEYKAFQSAYDFFNKELFQGQLPNPLFTFQRRAHTRGYFKPNSFRSRNDKSEMVAEIALNPDAFTGKSDRDILSVVVHEMCHSWQQFFGTPPRRGYHDREWAAKMKEIGLHPSHTEAVGGKETGQHMRHYILDYGPYARAYAKLRKQGFKLNWQSAPQDETTKRRTESKTKFTCGACHQNAWARPSAGLVCKFCQIDMKPAVVYRTKQQWHAAYEGVSS